MGCGGSKEEVATGNLVSRCRTLLSNKSKTGPSTSKNFSSMASTTCPSNVSVTEEVCHDQKASHEPVIREEDEEQKVARVRTIQRASKESMDEYFSPKKLDDDAVSAGGEGADDSVEDDVIIAPQNIVRGEEELHVNGGIERSSGEANEKVNKNEGKDDTMPQEDKEAGNVIVEMIESREKSNGDEDAINMEKKMEMNDVKEPTSTQ